MSGSRPSGGPPGSPSEWQRTRYPGIFVRHEKACASDTGGRCRCQRSWRVKYRDGGGEPKWSRTIKSEAEARNWRTDEQGTKTRQAQSTKPGMVFNELFDEWYALAESGAVTQKGGRAFSKGTLDTYRRMYTNHTRPEIGKRDATKLTARDWQLWLDGLNRKGLKRNSISVTLNCVRSIYRWACAPMRLILVVNATRGLELPAFDETPRDRVATPDEAQKLVAALSGVEQVSYALSLFAGLRNVERKPLDWSNVDFANGRIWIRFTKGGEAGAGIRSLPITAPLRPILRAEWMKQGQPSKGLVCLGLKGGAPDIDSMRERAEKAWTKVGLEPIGFHECRHTFITTLIHAGLNMKAVSVLAGHASIQVTADRYGHMFPGSEHEAGVKLDVLYATKAQAVATEDLESLSREDLISK